MTMNAAADGDVIHVEDLECRYGSEVILQGVSFSVKRGEIFFIAGTSGCGKSTLLRHMLGLMPPSRGRIVYFGRDFTNAPFQERRELVRTFGVLFQDCALWTDMSLFENVSLPLWLNTRLPGETRAEIVGLKLAQVGLAGLEDRLPRELSGGMQKRAAMARALALDPAILFFDEPTAGLDPVTVEQIDDLILKVRETVGATVVVVSHSLASIFQTADRMILLDEETKGILAEGSPRQLAAASDQPKVREFLKMDLQSKGRKPAGMNSNQPEHGNEIVP